MTKYQVSLKLMAIRDLRQMGAHYLADIMQKILLESLSSDR